MKYENLDDANAFIALVLQQKEALNNEYLNQVVEAQKIGKFAQELHAQKQELETRVQELQARLDEVAVTDEPANEPTKSSKNKNKH